MALTSAPALLVLHAVRITGMADVAGVSARFDLPHDAVEEQLLDDEAYGWVQRVRFRDVQGWGLTERGRVEGERRLAAELDASGARAVVARSHDEFVALNAAFLSTITDWQLRHTGAASTARDPLEWRRDEHALARLGDLHRRLEPVGGRLADALARFGGYADRLGAALARAETGERSYVDGVGVDSCHTVWFELHEDLLATLGLERGAAGAGA